MTSGGIVLSGIVLAGGQSDRFGSDKLMADLAGRPLIAGPIEVLAGICDEVVVAIGSGPAPELPAGLPVPVRVVRDPVPRGGPLVGLIAGLETALGSVALVVGGDMPGLVPALLRALVARLTAPGVDGSALRDGAALRPLPAALRRSIALDRACAVRAGGGSSLRALLSALRVDEVEELAWRRLDPEGLSLLDVDRPEQLREAQRRIGASRR